MESNCRRCTLQDEKAYRDLDDQQKYFLMPMTGDFQHALTVQGELVDRFNGEIPSQVTLITRNHNSSTVGVAKYPDKVVFSEGWAKFVETFDIQEGGSVLLRYTGDTQYSVMIFDKFGCEEPLSVLHDYYSLSASPAKGCEDAAGGAKYCQKCKDLDEYRCYRMDNEDKYFLVSLKGNFRHEMTVPEEFVKRFKGALPGEITLETRSGNSYCVAVVKHADKSTFSSGWGAFINTYDLHMNDSIVFKYNGNSRFHGIILSRVGYEIATSVVVNFESMNHAHDLPETMHMRSPQTERQTSLQGYSTTQGNSLFPQRFEPPELPYVVTKKTRLTENQKKKILERVRPIYRGIPIFVVLIRKSNIDGNFDLEICNHAIFMVYLPMTNNLFQIYDYILPKKYVEEYLGRTDQIIFLQRGGQRHEAKLCTHVVSKFSNGAWKRFVMANKDVKVGDICMFELLKDRVTYQMNVHIIRGYEVADG